MSVELYERASELLEATVADEVVGLDPQKGLCFGFNAVATAVWRELEQPRSFEQLQQLLLANYEVSPEQCSLELRELLTDLIKTGLVRVRAGGSGLGAARGEPSSGD